MLRYIRKHKHHQATAMIPIGEQGVKLATETGLEELLADCLYELSACYYRIGEHAATIVRLQQAFGVYQQYHNYNRMARALNLLGLTEQAMGEIPTAISRFEQAAQIFQELAKPEQVAWVWNNLGSAWGALGRWEEALVWYRRAIAKQRHLDDSVRCTIYRNIGVAYRLIGDVVQARNFLMQALQLAQSTNNVSGKQSTLDALGALESTCGEYSAAIICFQEALALAQSLGYRHKQALLLYHVANLYHRIGQPQEAVPLSNEAIQIFEALGEQQWLAIALGDGARIKLDAEGWQTALAQYQRALAIHYRYQTKIHHRNHYANCWNGLAECLRQAGMVGEGLVCATWAIDICREIQNKELLVGALQTAGEIYGDAGETELGATFLEEALALAETEGTNSIIYPIAQRLAQLHELSGNLSRALNLQRLRTEAYQRATTTHNDHALRLRMAQFQQAKLQADNTLLRLQAHNAEEQTAMIQERAQAITLQLLHTGEGLGLLATQLRRLLTAQERQRMEPLFHQLQRHLNSDPGWEVLQQQVAAIHPTFIRSLKQHPEPLTATEQKICLLLRLALRAKQIATLLGTSVRTVEGHCLNIRRKLKLPHTTTVGEALRLL